MTLPKLNVPKLRLPHAHTVRKLSLIAEHPTHFTIHDGAGPMVMAKAAMSPGAIKSARGLPKFKLHFDEGGQEPGGTPLLNTPYSNESVNALRDGQEDEPIEPLVQPLQPGVNISHEDDPQATAIDHPELRGSELAFPSLNRIVGGVTDAFTPSGYLPREQARNEVGASDAAPITTAGEQAHPSHPRLLATMPPGQQSAGQVSSSRGPQGAQARVASRTGGIRQPAPFGEPQGDDVSDYQRYMDTVARAGKMAAVQQAAYGDEVVKQNELTDIDAGIRRDAYEKKMAAHQEKINAKLDDPENPDRIYGGSTGRKVLAAISMGLGSVGSALSKTPNYAMQIINDAVNKDIEAQRHDKQSTLNGYIQEGHSIQDAEMLARSDAMQKAQRAIQGTAAKFGGYIDANKAAQAAALAGAAAVAQRQQVYGRQVQNQYASRLMDDRLKTSAAQRTLLYDRAKLLVPKGAAAVVPNPFLSAPEEPTAQEQADAAAVQQALSGHAYGGQIHHYDEGSDDVEPDDQEEEAPPEETVDEPTESAPQAAPHAGANTAVASSPQGVTAESLAGRFTPQQIAAYNKTLRYQQWQGQQAQQVRAAAGQPAGPLPPSAFPATPEPSTYQTGREDIGVAINPKILNTPGAQWKDLRERAVQVSPGRYALAYTTKEAEKARDLLATADDLQSTINDMRQFQHEHGATVPYSDADKIGDQLYAKTVAKVNELAALKRLSAEDIKLIKSQLVHPGSFRQDVVTNSLQSLQDTLNQRVTATVRRHLIATAPTLAGHSPAPLRPGQLPSP